MRKNIFVIIVLFFALYLHAETSVWKISNGDNILYIGGTIHILRESDYPLPEPFYTAFDESEIIVFESTGDPMDIINNEQIKLFIDDCNIISEKFLNEEKIILFNELVTQFSVMLETHEKVYDSFTNPEIILTEDETKIFNEMLAIIIKISEESADEQIAAYIEVAQNLEAKMNVNEEIKSFINLFLNPDNKSLELILSSETFNVIESLCEKYNYPVLELKYLKPHMAYTILTMHVITQFATVDGVDTYFYEKAIEQDKKVEYFETQEFQFNLLANLGNEYGNSYYDYIFAVLDSYKENQMEMEFSEMVDVLKNGIVDNGAMEYEREYFPLVYEAMVKNRNNSWMPVIEKYLKTPAVEFILVGQGHLHGPDGLLNQLSEKGYMIEKK
ncbi:MAG: TraB/GumN family protein [Spirochaetaceae bacterium]|nr:TraB/GumN family protein [Spirochaetaceae bacterium]